MATSPASVADHSSSTVPTVRSPGCAAIDAWKEASSAVESANDCGRYPALTER